METTKKKSGNEAFEQRMQVEMAERKEREGMKSWRTLATVVVMLVCGLGAVLEALVVSESDGSDADVVRLIVLGGVALWCWSGLKGDGFFDAEV